MSVYDKTIKELILGDIKEVCEGIKLSNGADNNIKTVERYEQSGNSKVDWPFLLIHTGTEKKTQKPSLVTECKLTVILELTSRHDKDRYKMSTDEYINSLAYDLEYEVMKDYQRSGYADYTSIESVDPFDILEGAAYCGVIATLEINYKHKTGNPKEDFT